MDGAEGGAAMPGSAAREAAEAAKEVGDESRVEQRVDIRTAVLDALGSFGTRTSGVVIVGDKVQFQEPVVGGDYGGDYGGDRRSVGVLEPYATRSLMTIERMYVEPPGYRDLRAAFGSGSVMLLQVRRRWGGTTTALHLLYRGGPVYRLRSDAPLGLLPVDELPKGAGFLLDGATASQLAGVTLRDVESLAERLSQRDARMIVLLDPAVRAGNPAVLREVRSLTAPPDARALVHSVLADALGGVEDASRLLAEGSVCELLADITPENVDVAQLTELATDLVDVSRGRIAVDQALARFNNRCGEDVREWLDEMSDPGDFALVVALAVLHGMPYDAVSRCAAMLERTLRDYHANAQQPPVGHTRRSRSARLQAARARLGAEVRSTRYGAAELEVAAFVDSGYPARVLSYIWHEYDQERDLLLGWLQMVAQDVEDRIRIRAAAAIGYLACHSFDPIRRDVIVGWAGSGNGSERERAVAALALPARHPATAARAIRLASDWCEKDKPALRCTAARALGTSVGAVLPGGPDELLGRLAEGADVRLALEIGESIAELLVDTDAERRYELLSMLERWSAEGRAGRQRAGVFGFLDVASTLWTRVGEDERSTWWPSMLWWAVGQPPDGSTASPRVLVARLWQRSLVSPGADYAVRRVLGSWATAAEHTAPIRAALISLLVDVAATPRHAKLLTYHAKTWRDRKPAAPDTAQRLLDVLTGKGQGL
jgi:hypothetical protein